MKREILFRGKRVDNREWAEGFYLEYIGMDAKDEGGKPVCHIVSANIIQNFHLVIPETVGQFTGLTDKNGVKIFEGDEITSRVIMYSDKNYETREVKFYEGMFSIGAVPLHILTMDSSFAPEVTGNIHDQ